MARARFPGTPDACRRIARSALLLLAVGPAALSGQGPRRAAGSSAFAWGGAADPARPAWERVRPGDARGSEAPPRISPTRALLYSGTLPGWGQRRLDKMRWLGFVAVELAGWGVLLERQRTGRDFRTRYRDLAWFVARRGTVGRRMDGDFEYYEALGRYRASGAFDADPFANGVQPETDTATYNGAVWSLATEIFPAPGAGKPPEPGSPEYEHAMEYYVGRSIGARFQWDWNGDEASRAEYDRLIRRSDAALRQVTTVVGVILANHLAAAFDAFVAARLRAADSSAELRLGVVPDALGRWWVGGELLP